MKKRFTKKELEILKTLWNSAAPMIASEIAKANNALNLNTVHACLRSLSDKGAIKVEREPTASLTNRYANWYNRIRKSWKNNSAKKERIIRKEQLDVIWPLRLDHFFYAFLLPVYWVAFCTLYYIGVCIFHEIQWIYCLWEFWLYLLGCCSRSTFHLHIPFIHIIYYRNSWNLPLNHWWAAI